MRSIHPRTYVLVAILHSLTAAPSFAQAPGWSRGQQDLPVGYEECRRRAPAALQAEGFRIDYDAGAFSVGIKSVHTAVISCHPLSASNVAVNIVVASNGEGGGTERQRLQGRMEGSATTTTTPPPPPPPTTTPTTNTSGRMLVVHVNSPGIALVDWRDGTANTGSWVSVVPVGTTDGNHVGKWVYTKGASTGRYDSGLLSPGEYEARFYADGGYTALIDRVRFTVGSLGLAGGGMIRVHVFGRRAFVDWTSAPTDVGTWVSVVPVGTGDGAHIGQWVYTKGAPSGRYESGALTPGEYEARIYGDSGYAKLVERVRFTVP